MNAATISAAKSGNIKVGDFTVHRLGYGAMRLTGPGIWGLPKDRSNAIRVLRRAVELGVNFIDTSDAYGPNTNEELIAEALHPYSSGLVIATKGGLTRPGPDIWERNGRPSHLKQACEASLQRLRVERIDLYQLHAIDPQVPLEESLGALARLQQEGRIRHIGVSNFTVRDLQRAEKVVKLCLFRIATTQPIARMTTSSPIASNVALHSFPGIRWQQDRMRSQECCRRKFEPSCLGETSPLRKLRSPGYWPDRTLCCRFRVPLRLLTWKKMWQRQTDDAEEDFTQSTRNTENKSVWTYRDGFPPCGRNILSPSSITPSPHHFFSNPLAINS
jgi:hypothetical protein